MSLLRLRLQTPQSYVGPARRRPGNCNCCKVERYTGSASRAGCGARINDDGPTPWGALPGYTGRGDASLRRRTIFMTGGDALRSPRRSKACSCKPSSKTGCQTAPVRRCRDLRVIFSPGSHTATRATSTPITRLRRSKNYCQRGDYHAGAELMSATDALSHLEGAR